MPRIIPDFDATTRSIVMHNDMTRKYIELIKKELDQRCVVPRPKLLEAIKVAQGFDNLSKSFEYKAA